MSGEIFAPDKLRKYVHEALLEIPDGAKRIVLGYVDTDGAVHVKYVERINAHWTAGAILDHAPKEGWTGRVMFQGVW